MTHFDKPPCHFCNQQAIINLEVNSHASFKLCAAHLGEYLGHEVTHAVGVIIFAKVHNQVPERNVPKSTDEERGEYRTNEQKEE